MQEIQTRTEKGAETYQRLRDACQPYTARKFERTRLTDIAPSIWRELEELNLIEKTDIGSLHIHVKIIKRDERYVYFANRPEHNKVSPCWK